MQKKSNKKRTALTLFISGLIALFLGVILMMFANYAEEEAGYLDSEGENAIQVVKGFSTFSFIDAGIEIVAAVILAAIAGDDDDSSNLPSNPNSYIRYNYPDRTPESGFWICPKCKRENANYVGTCACGEARPSVRNNAHNISSTLKYCPSCGEKATGQSFCSNCGYKLK